MSVKRIIPCMDVMDGRVVKGVNFVNMVDAGDPAAFGRYYSEQGADEVVFLDISATVENRGTMTAWVRRAAEQVSVPFTVGGGIRTLADMEVIFAAGAHKVSVNSAAVADRTLIRRAAERFGSDRIVVAVDARRTSDGGYEVLVKGGQEGTGMDVVSWAKECQAMGAGSLLLTSLDADGTKEGYDIEMTRAVADAVAIPVVASGGCGCLEDFFKGLTEGGAEAALAASLFHFGVVTIPQVKAYLRGRGVDVL